MATSEPEARPAGDVGDKIRVWYPPASDSKRTMTLNEFLNLSDVDDPNFQQLQRSLSMYAESEAGKAQLQSLAKQYDTLFSGESDLLIKVQPLNEDVAAAFRPEKNEILFSPQLLSHPHRYIPNRDRAVSATMMHEVSHALDDNMLENGPTPQQKYESEMNAKLAEVKLEVELFGKSADPYTNSLSNFAQKYYSTKERYNAEYADQWFKWYLVSSSEPSQAVCSWRRFYSKSYANQETTDPLLRLDFPEPPNIPSKHTSEKVFEPVAQKRQNSAEQEQEDRLERIKAKYGYGKPKTNVKPQAVKVLGAHAKPAEQFHEERLERIKRKYNPPSSKTTRRR